MKSSNDKKELSYKPNDFLTDFLNVCDNEKDIIAKEFFCLIDESIKLNKSKFFEECKKKSLPYALCLSEKKDNLTHWDRYASNCTGVCIGFNVSSLRVYMKRMALTALGIGVYDIEKIFYSSEQKEKHIRDLIIYIINVLIKKSGIENREIKEFVRKNGYVYAVSTCILLMRFCKDSSFVDEDEVRLYHDTASIKDTLYVIDQLAPHIKPELHKNLKKHFAEFIKQLRLREERFCMTNSGIRSYRGLYLEEIWGSGVIPEIILGPLCIQNRNELSRFLKANGLEGTKVSVSKVPIR